MKAGTIMALGCLLFTATARAGDYIMPQTRNLCPDSHPVQIKDAFGNIVCGPPWQEQPKCKAITLMDAFGQLQEVCLPVPERAK